MADDSKQFEGWFVVNLIAKVGIEILAKLLENIAGERQEEYYRIFKEREIQSLQDLEILTATNLKTWGITKGSDAEKIEKAASKLQNAASKLQNVTTGTPQL
jgi:hypothetical protein